MPYIKEAVSEQVSALESVVPDALDLANAVRTAVGASHPAYTDATTLVSRLGTISDIVSALRGVADDIPPEPIKSGRGWDGNP